MYLIGGPIQTPLLLMGTPLSLGDYCSVPGYICSGVQPGADAALSAVTLQALLPCSQKRLGSQLKLGQLAERQREFSERQKTSIATAVLHAVQGCTWLLTS